MEARDFYVTLSSNASVLYYPENHLAHFWNRVSEPVSLKDPTEWEVGLSEIFTPPTRLREYSEQDLTVELIGWVSEGDGDDVTKTAVKNYAILKPFITSRGFVKSLSEALKECDEVFSGGGVQVAPGFVWNRAMLRLQPDVWVKFSERMTNVLGLQRDWLTAGFLGQNKRGEIRAYDLSVDANAGFHTVWVYSNCCEHRLVGGARVPLLRTVLAGLIPGQMSHNSYTTPQYMGVRGGHFPSLEILITDNTGKEVPFHAGEVVVTLHFRRSRVKAITR